MFNFGQRLRQVRHELGLTQKEFASKIGIAERQFQGYEAGGVIPNLRVVFAILNTFNVDANYLLGRIDNPPKVASSQALTA